MDEWRNLAAEFHAQTSGWRARSLDRVLQLGGSFAERDAVEVGGDADDVLAVVAFNQAGHSAGFESCYVGKAGLR